MRRPVLAPPRTIRGSLLTLISIALTPLVVFGAYEVVFDYRKQRDADIAASAEVARIVGSSFDSFVQALLSAEHAAAISIAKRGHSMADIQDELAGVQAEFPSIRDVNWIAPDGTILASTEQAILRKSLFARDYFQEIAAGAEWRVSRLVRSLADGSPVFAVARALRQEGRLVGIISASVSADRLGTVLGQRSGEGLTSLVDSTGTLVALQTQAPIALDWEARHRTADQPWVQRALAGHESAGIFTSLLTGERRVGATVPIHSIGWGAHASRSLAEAMAPVQGLAVVHAAVLFAVVLVALGAALLLGQTIIGPLRALEQHAVSLGSDRERNAPNVPVRGPIEVRRVGRALQEMASAVAARRAELEAVNRRLAESEERFRSLAENAAKAAGIADARRAELDAVISALPIGVLIVDAALNPIRINDAAREILGLRSEDLGRAALEAARLRICGPDGERIPAQELPSARALRGERVEGEIHCMERDAGRPPLWVTVGTAPIRDAAGGIHGVVTTLVDITPLRELQDERETLMSTVSHDLRTPLHVVVGHAEMLRRQGDDETRRRSEVILASAGRMARLIGDLVDAARFETGQVALHLEPTDLVGFLTGWKERIAGALDIERVGLTTPDVVPVVLADAARLDQILVNLVSNALKYSVPGSDVHVALRPTPSALRLSVSDRGVGIAPEELPRVFDRYYRAKSAGRAEGLGLGLYITRKLVDAHGWTMEVTSELGAGSTFTVVVPVFTAKAARSTAA